MRKDGALRWVRNTLVPRFDSSGALVAYDGLIQDITERRALQDQLLQAQKMEGIGRLAGGIAHDFNNLLTAILGYLEMARLDLPADLPAEHALRADLDEIGAAGERAASLTHQLLAFASKQIVAPVRLDLSALVADLLKMLRPLLGENIAVETVLEPDIGTIEADPGQIQQLLVNLTVNAADAMPDGGRLIIETATRGRSGVLRRGAPGGRLGQPRPAVGDRHRLRHERGGPRPPVRAVLHDQGAGQGHRARAGGVPRHRARDGRPHPRLLGAGQRDHVPHLPAARGRARGRAAGGRAGLPHSNRNRDRPRRRGRAGRPPPGGPGPARPGLHRDRGVGRGRGAGDRRAHRRPSSTWW